MRARLSTPGLLAALFALASVPVASAASLSVGSGASLDLGTGTLDLGCADLTVGGTLSAGTAGFSQARDVTIDPTGLVNGESATLEVAGDWDNAGTFNAGTSTVQLVDGCTLTSAVIAGDTTFANLDMTTTSGFLYSFTSGSTQTVTGALALQGEAANLLTIRSTLDGSEALLNVQGSSTGDFVDVQDNDASGGNTITLGPNSVKGSNTPGWLTGALVPALGALGLALLGLSLLWSGRRVLATRRGSLARH
jgi:hypothetical protein